MNACSWSRTWLSTWTPILLFYLKQVTLRKKELTWRIAYTLRPFGSAGCHRSNCDVDSIGQVIT